MSEYTKNDWYRYYNTPTEVKARIVEFSSYFINSPEDYSSFDDFLNKIPRADECWKFLETKNKNIILSALYSKWERSPRPKNTLRYFALVTGVRITLENKQKPIDVAIPQREKRKYEKKKVESERRWMIEGNGGLWKASDIADIFAQEYKMAKRYSSEPIILEIRTPYKGYDNWDGDYSEEVKSPSRSKQVQSVLEKMEWPIGYWSVIQLEGYNGPVYDQYFKRVR